MDVKEKIIQLYFKYKKDVYSMSFFLVIIFAVRSIIICPYTVPTGSMEPTIKAGDRIFVNKMAYNLRVPFTEIPIISFTPPSRGDIIAFKYPLDPSIDYIKRIVGIPSDKITIEGGRIYINDKLVQELPLSDRNILNDISDPNREIKEIYEEKLGDIKHIIVKNPPLFSRNMEGIWVVPSGHYFVMGDNRDNSEDSRYWRFVPMRYVHGSALFVFFSFFWEGWVPQIRFDRFFSQLI